jgi:SAM-dependent methyltransferase
MERQLEPEILDELPAEDPRAVRSRKDLRRVNWFMGNAGHIAKALREHAPIGTSSILEIGCGDGSLMLKVAKRLRWKRAVNLYLLDRQDIVVEATKRQFTDLGWKAKVIQRDLLQWIESPEPKELDVVVCNLFAHHFSEGKLRQLFEALAQRTKLFVACEPWRNRFAPAATDFLWLLGCSEVTRHDARISIHAGFRDLELSALWPGNSGFTRMEKRTGFFSHLFVARKV